MSLRTIIQKIIAFFKNIFNNNTAAAASVNLGIFKPKNRNMYALIVGINKYAYKETSGKITDLNGCVRDATRVQDYLKSITADGDFNFHPVVLFDEDATHANIVSNFKHHLTKATENDVALFYHSGHGAQEKADTLWSKAEDDGLLETIVCHDTQNQKNGIPGLADKELRYLINLIAQKNPHIVTISDSCHSGDNTRAGELRKRCIDFSADIQPDTTPEQARLTSAFPMRTWDQFCFADKIAPEAILSADALEDVIPQGKHIAFAACRDHELAYETLGANSSGIFTTTLLDVLKRSNGHISYYDLYARIKNTVFGRQNSQMPQVYASSGNSMDLQETFLSGASRQKPYYYNVSKNPTTSLGWIIDVGAIHGMPSPDTSKALVINILDTNDSSKILTTATPRKVMPGYTQLNIADKKALKAQSYTATIEGLFSNPVNFYVAGVSKGVDALQAYADTKIDEIKRSNVNLVEDMALADYMIFAKSIRETAINYFIVPPIDESKAFGASPSSTNNSDAVSWKHLTKPCMGTDNTSLGTLVSYMQHITRWEFLKRLHNPSTALVIDDFISVKFYQGKYHERKLVEKKALIPNENNVIEIGFPYTSRSRRPINFLLIDFQNIHSDETIYAAMPALFNDFSVYTDVLRGGSLEFKPKHKESANKGQALPYEMGDHIQDFNHEYVSIFFPLIVSISKFDVNNLTQEGLPLPSLNRDTERATEEIAGGTVKPISKKDWATKIFEIRFKNPHYIKPLKG